MCIRDRLDTDTKEVPEVLRLESPQYLGSEDVDISRYTTRDWHELEVEHIWRKAWQFACRADEIPEVGDYLLYEIVRDSYIVMRTEDGIRDSVASRGLGDVYKRQTCGLTTLAAATRRPFGSWWTRPTRSSAANSSSTLRPPSKAPRPLRIE